MTTNRNPSDVPASRLEVDIKLDVTLSVSPTTDPVPYEVLRRYTYPAHSAVLLRTIEAAQDLGLQMLVENWIDDSGQAMLEVSVYSDDVRVNESEIDGLWPHPLEWSRVRSEVTDDQDGLLDDPRWGEFAARAVYVWVYLGRRRSDDAEDEGCELMWFVDFSDTPLTGR